MPNELELTLKRFANFLRDVIDPAVYPQSVPAVVEAHPNPDPKAPLLSAQDAVDVAYVPVSLGYRWGPKWATCWFRVTGTVPAEFAGRSVAMRFSTATEGTVWRRVGNGPGSGPGVGERYEPVQGLDVNRDSIPLFATAHGGERVLLHIEAACNHPFGTFTFEWDDVEAQRRWNDPNPGRLDRCELAVVDERVRELSWRYAFALGLLKEMPADSARAQDLVRALTRATNTINDANVSATASAALDVLGETLAQPAGGSATLCHAVGHAHIDTAWLWPIRETRRKIVRSWSNVIGLMDRFKDFKFLCSQTQQYVWCEADAPELFEKIKARVADGRWEPGGAMWIEPDINVPSGESLVRQFLKADRWWKSRFGDKAAQRHMYLPDTFGFTPVMPQLMKLAGLDTFITNKLHWNQFNLFPHATFRWRGIDGTEVLGHNTPGKDYNAVNTPMELRRGDSTLAKASAHGGTTGRWLQPFGYGDGGGGPTDRSIRYAQFAHDCDGLAKVTMTTARDFCAALHRDVETMQARGESLPAWDGELYLELHRGTLTTQAWLKKANRHAEVRLKAAEMLVVFAGNGGAPSMHDDLDTAWKTLLLNQFHDILPGSSITWVYDDARADHQRLAGLTDRVIEQAGNAVVGSAKAPSQSAVLNSANSSRSEVVEVDGQLGFVAGIPALSVSAANVSTTLPAGVTPATAKGLVLENGLLRVELNAHGEVARLSVEGPGIDGGSRNSARQGPALGSAASPLNQLWLYEDRPHFWEAWDVDGYYEQKGERVGADAAAVTIKVVNAGPMRAAIEVSRSMGHKSQITQTYTLDAGSHRVDVRTRIDWHESRRLLRALFPTDIRASFATFEIQFGHVQRPTHRNTPWDMARFEVFGHRWSDLSEPGRGLAVLNDGKYGHSCHAEERGGTLGLSLLRSTKYPDPEADMGVQEFTYSLLPHAGDWRGAGVIDEADALNEPLRFIGRVEAGFAPRQIVRVSQSDDGARAVVTAIKPAEHGQGTIVRLHEAHGGSGVAEIVWKTAVTDVQAVDILERPMTLEGMTHQHGVTRVRLTPFQVVTLRTN
jgi:alpha-mannosidase